VAPFTKELNVAMAAADAARPVLLSYFGNLSQVSEKDQAGLVTEADRASEDKIIEILKKEFPAHVFLGEESGLSTGKQLHAEQALKDGSVWMIDPLDGTTNYVHQFPIFCISIALQVKGELAVAVIDVPILQQRFYACRGGGAYLNDKKLQVAQRSRWNETLLATGFSTSGANEINQQVEVMRKFLLKTRGIRRAGSAAYDLCMVAQGVVDGFWEASLSPWDTAAGTLLVREAGGVVSNYQGEYYRPTMPSIVAGSRAIHSQLLADIQG
jgi:myo-inositol-1(or 4)-monophosphatase